MAKTFKVRNMDVWLEIVGHYGNGRIAIRLYCNEGVLTNLTVNIDDVPLFEDNPYASFINTEYTWDYYDFLINNNFATPTGRVVEYDGLEKQAFPEVIFNKDFLKEYDADNFEEYDAFQEAYRDVKEIRKMQENKS